MSRSRIGIVLAAAVGLAGWAVLGRALDEAGGRDNRLFTFFSAAPTRADLSQSAHLANLAHLGVALGVLGSVLLFVQVALLRDDSARRFGAAALGVVALAAAIVWIANAFDVEHGCGIGSLGCNYEADAIDNAARHAGIVALCAVVAAIAFAASNRKSAAAIGS